MQFLNENHLALRTWDKRDQYSALISEIESILKKLSGKAVSHIDLEGKERNLLMGGKAKEIVLALNDQSRTRAALYIFSNTVFSGGIQG